MGERGMGYGPQEARRDASFKAAQAGPEKEKSAVPYDRNREEMEFDGEGNQILMGEPLEADVIEFPKKKPDETKPKRKAA